MSEKVFTVEVQTVYNCSLQRAFRAPILGDVTKVHTGKGIMPRVTHCTDDHNWGQVGSSKKVFVAKSLTQKGGFASIDHILERIENEYWKIQVDDFQSWMLGFYKFVGEWKCNAIGDNQIQINYIYHLHTNSPFWYPMAWMFTRLFWKSYMRQVLENIRKMAEGSEDFPFQ